MTTTNPRAAAELARARPPLGAPAERRTRPRSAAMELRPRLRVAAVDRARILTAVAIAVLGAACATPPVPPPPAHAATARTRAFAEARDATPPPPRCADPWRARAAAHDAYARTSTDALVGIGVGDDAETGSLTELVKQISVTVTLDEWARQSWSTALGERVSAQSTQRLESGAVALEHAEIIAREVRGGCPVVVRAIDLARPRAELADAEARVAAVARSARRSLNLGRLGAVGQAVDELTQTCRRIFELRLLTNRRDDATEACLEVPRLGRVAVEVTLGPSEQGVAVEARVRTPLGARAASGISVHCQRGATSARCVTNSSGRCDVPLAADGTEPLSCNPDPLL